ncbi:hypothetical protein [Alteromonas gilva]|uniref:Secreted protein n=1 Tax=Alteromonas gilva TaxID=2987522 RepID=A0ABT5L734_9ALTE|nr:hypothetical protein [Alteromonas gilva]MDC8832880.1 hypothetical protein [Alteromonas gilva]
MTIKGYTRLLVTVLFAVASANVSASIFFNINLGPGNNIYRELGIEPDDFNFDNHFVEHNQMECSTPKQLGSRGLMEKVFASHIDSNKQVADNIVLFRNKMSEVMVEAFSDAITEFRQRDRYAKCSYSVASFSNNFSSLNDFLKNGPKVVLKLIEKSGIRTFSSVNIDLNVDTGEVIQLTVQQVSPPMTAAQIKATLSNVEKKHGVTMKQAHNTPRLSSYTFQKEDIYCGIAFKEDLYPSPIYKTLYGLSEYRNINSGCSFTELKKNSVYEYAISKSETLFRERAEGVIQMFIEEYADQFNQETDVSPVF